MTTSAFENCNVRSPSGIFSTASPPSYSEVPGTIALNDMQEDTSPPSYDDVINPEASPPTYQSLFSQMREARKNSSDFLDFLQKAIVLLFGIIGCIIYLAFLIAIPVIMIIVGALFFGECPVEELIPIYLIVVGAFLLVKILMFIILMMCNGRDTDQNRYIFCLSNSILNCILITCLMIGGFFTYKVYEPEYKDRSSPFYCNSTLYIVTCSSILIGLGSVLMCFVVSSICICMVHSSDSRKPLLQSFTKLCDI